MKGDKRNYFLHRLRKDNKYYSNYKKVKGANIYVLTNMNANATCKMIIDILEKYGIPITSVRIFLKEDEE